MLSIIDSSGVERFLGNLDPEASQRYAWRVFGDTPDQAMIPRSDWGKYISAQTDVFGSSSLTPIHDQDGIGMCVPVNTLVRMADGTEKKIQDVRVMDMVLSAEGNPQMVLKTMVREEKSSIFRLKVWGHRILECTGEHPILTKRGYVAAKDITLDDWVVMPKYMPCVSSEPIRSIMPANYVQTKYHASRARGVRQIGLPGRKVVSIVRNRPPDIIHLDADFGWVVGLFLAEGSTSHGKVNWTLGLHEEETVAAELVAKLKRSLGVDAVIRVMSGGAGKSINVTIYGVWWVQMFNSLCGVGAANKTPHSDIIGGSTEFLTSVLDGYMAGDGHRGKSRDSASSVSRELAMAMYDIAQFIGLMPLVRKVIPNPISMEKAGIRTRRDYYVVEWATGDGRKDHAEQDDRNVYRRVAGIEEKSFSGWVYNLEVENDNSYVADGIGVHNCNASATAAAIEMARSQAGLPYVALSGGDLYRRICGGSDRGSLLEDGIREAMNNGVAEVSVVPYLEWRRAPSGWQESARRHIVLEASLCPTFDHVASALLHGFPVVMGMMWSNSDDVDGDGWLPSRGGGGGGGHALCSYKLAERGGKYGAVTRNSWKDQWGRDGLCVIPESRFGRQVTGNWAVRVVVQGSGDMPLPVGE